MEGRVNQFLRGAIVMACVVAATLFLRCWRDSRDRLFLAFMLAFLVLALHWAILALAGASTETEHYFYITRLVAFTIIAIAVVERNRRK